MPNRKNAHLWLIAVALFSLAAIINIVKALDIHEMGPPLAMIPSLFVGLAWASYRRQRQRQ